MTDAFRHRTTLQVRFRDTDAFGHVNNAVFASYAELARVRYLIDVLQPAERFDRLPLILARLELDFRSPIEFGEDVVVETRVDRIGTTSFAMSHRMTAGPTPVWSANCRRYWSRTTTRHPSRSRSRQPGGSGSRPTRAETWQPMRSGRTPRRRADPTTQGDPWPIHNASTCSSSAGA